MNSQKNKASDYNPHELEKKWKEKWEKDKLYQPNLDTAKKPFYNLMMFPYPSAEGLHVGSVFTFTGVDTYGRFKRMQGHDVFEPIGLDGFGINSENYALKIGKHPKIQAEISEKNFYRQLSSIGNSYDWSRKLETYDPNYYKWTQWIFIQLFKKGLAYRKKAPVNFCPKDLTVLADEQVIDGKCERCGSIVEKRQLEQWFFKITAYADRLLNNIFRLNWTEKVKIAQRDWIGKKEGTLINFAIKGKYKFVLLHGYTGSPDGFSWIKNELEKMGHGVIVPSLPNTNDPDVYEQTQYVLENVKFDENTILLGHSLGSVVALKVLEKLKNPIKRTIVAAGFMQPKFKDKKRPFEDKFDWKFDVPVIKKNMGELIILRPSNDSAVNHERATFVEQTLGGIIIDFTAEGDHITGEKEPVVLQNLQPQIEVFTTRGDTLYGATFLVVAPEHPFASQIEDKKVQDYIKRAREKTDIERTADEKEKTGVFSGLYAINPLNDEKVPVWIADYALMGFGTGALFGDAHDERDVLFAKKYGIKLKPTLNTGDKERDKKIMNLEEVFTGDGFLVDSGEFSGLNSKDARVKVAKWLEDHGKGGRITTYHLRDWLISRQRYWGPPIPMIFCEKCDWQPVPDDQLPVLLPDVEDWKPKGTGSSPLANIESFVKTTCPKCGGEAKRETDVSDTFLDSSWYFFRYIATEVHTEASKRERVEKWLPVTMYIGGAEHSVLHLLYSRFITMVFKDMGLIDFEEPFERFYAHGLIIKDGAKMSKSKGNVVNPDEYLDKYGVDTVRAYLRFVGPFDMGGDFRDSGIDGMARFLKRVWKLVESTDYSLQTTEDDKRVLNKTVKGVTEDLENLRFNTVIAKLMTYYNYLSSKKGISKEEARIFIQLIAPVTPFLAEELWEKIGEEYSVHTSKWPNYDEKYLEESIATVVVQINGKVRSTLMINDERLKNKEEIERLAREDEKIKKNLEGKAIKKVIYVPGKIINFVAN